MAFVVEFAVVIVFDDDGVLAAGPLEQREAARERENGARWELVRWSDEDQARPDREACRIEAVAIDRDWDEMSSGGAQDSACAVVVRVFDGHAVAGLDEHAGDEIERLLRAVDDDDFRRIADDARERRRCAQMAARSSRLPTAGP